MNPLVLLIIILIALYIAMYVTAPLLTTFHELGHAIAIIALTNPKKIDIYIGSYGENPGKFNFSLGKLHFHINPTLSIKAGGLCRSDTAVTNYIHSIIVLLAGPLVTVSLSCFLGYFIFNSEIHGAIKLYFFCLIICAFIGLWLDLVPRTIKEHNLYNDGKLIVFTYKIRKFFSEYVHAKQLLSTGEDDEAISKLKNIISIFPYEEILIRDLIFALLLTKQFEEAKIQLLKLGGFTEFTIDDYINMAFCQILSDQNKEAEANLNIALRMNNSHPILLNNLGYVLILLENYDDAEQYLGRVIKLNPSLAEPYNNLGQLRLLTNQLEEGKALIEKSISLNPGNAHAYKNLGIYYSKIENIELAKFNFDKALELDSSIKIK